MFPEHCLNPTVVMFHRDNLFLMDVVAPLAMSWDQLGPVRNSEKHLEWQQTQTSRATPTCSTHYLQQCQSRPLYLTIHEMTQLQNPQTKLESVDAIQ